VEATDGRLTKSVKDHRVTDLSAGVTSPTTDSVRGSGICCLHDPLNVDHLMLTSDPRRHTEEGKEKTLLSRWRSVPKKCLTGPTLLEMSGYPFRDLARLRASVR
jgi:hypothetical protein